MANDITTFRNIGLDLGTSWYSIGKPEELKLYKSLGKNNKNLDTIIFPEEYSVWDVINIEGPMTAKQIIDFCKDKYDFSIYYINSNNQCLLDLVDDEDNEDINKFIEQLYEETFKIKILNKKYLKLTFLGTRNNENIKTPRIKYILKI